MARRIEYLGIGIYGSKTCAPNVNTEELANALVTVADGRNEMGKQMTAKAKELATAVAKYGGRKTAARKIIEFAGLDVYRCLQETEVM
jgi:hypothetical protein